MEQLQITDQGKAPGIAAVYGIEWTPIVTPSLAGIQAPFSDSGMLRFNADC